MCAPLFVLASKEIAKGINNLGIITISPVVTKSEIKGHPYWFHKTLREAALAEQLEYQTLGSRDNDGDEVTGVLEHPGYLRPASSFFTLLGLSRDASRISKLLCEKNSKTILHIYECGFRELLLVTKLLGNHKTVSAVVNLNFTDPWHLSLRGRSTLSRLTRFILRLLIKKFLNRISLCAETSETALAFAKSLKLPVETYPLFSTIAQETNNSTSVERQYDLVFFPADDSECNLVLQAIKKIRKSHPGFSARAVPRWGYQIGADLGPELQTLEVNINGDLLGAREYADMYRQSKVAVFPYVSDYYRHTSSGRVLDAAACGCMCIAPSEALAGKQIVREGWGLAFEEFSDGNNLASTIVRCLSAWPSGAGASIPTATNSLNRLVAISEKSSAYEPSSGCIPANLLALILAVLLPFSTGFRSWAPRLVQAFMNLRLLRSKSLSDETL